MQGVIIMFFTSLMAAITVFCLLMYILNPFRQGIDINKRLGVMADSRESDDVNILDSELQLPFTDRVIKPLIKKLSDLFNKVMPTYVLENTAPKLMKAGYPGGLTTGEYLILKLLGLAVIFLIAFTFFITGNVLVFFLIVAAGGGLAWLLPDLLLKSMASMRCQQIENSMPDVLDLLTVSVEAGYGWEGALQKVVEKRKGPLAGEMRRVLQEVKMGKPRRDAMQDMSERLKIDAVTTFVTAVIQADQLGLSMGHVLRSQADFIRHKRRQEIEEQAMKAPVKMLFPLVLFIFPVIFIVLLGPAAIQVIDTFSQQ